VRRPRGKSRARSFALASDAGAQFWPSVDGLSAGLQERFKPYQRELAAPLSLGNFKFRDLMQWGNRKARKAARLSYQSDSI
jgi:hypothetical protein